MGRPRGGRAQRVSSCEDDAFELEGSPRHVRAGGRIGRKQRVIDTADAAIAQRRLRFPNVTPMVWDTTYAHNDRRTYHCLLLLLLCSGR